MKSVVRVSTHGLMARDTMESGSITKCMAGVTSFGQMEKNMLVTSLKIKDMVRASSSGRMAENMKDNGLKESNMALEYIETLRERRKKESGRMEKESTGFDNLNNYINTQR